MTTLLLLVMVSQAPAAATSRVFGCQGPFTPDLTEQRLIEIYGAANVRTGDVYVGEGFSEPGAVVFPDSSSDRIEIVWSNGEKRAMPRFVRVNSKSSNWKTTDLITIGSDLKSIERINGRPFRLFGFGWDYSGSVASWAGGRLEREETAGCRVRMAMRPPGGAEGWPAVWQQVLGDREFSSGHPAMKQLNPQVYQLVLGFSRHH
jgi:hypothetical protein